MARSTNIGTHFSEKRIWRVLNIAPQIHSKVGCVNGGRRLGSLKDTKALVTAASREAGVHIESALTAGISGMFTAGSDPRGPDPGVGMVKGIKADRWVGFHVGDKAPALGTSRSDGVAPGMSDPERSLFVDRLVYPGHGRNRGEQAFGDTTRVHRAQKRGYVWAGDQMEREVRGVMVGPARSFAVGVVHQERYCDKRGLAACVLRFGFWYCTLVSSPIGSQFTVRLLMCGN